VLSSAATLADPCSLCHAVEGRIVLPTACDKEVATFAFGQDLGLPFLVAPWNILFQSARNDIHVVLTRKGKSSFGEKIPTN
jgi:hypothetical protein